MSQTPTSTTPHYIRGGGSIDIDPGRLGRLLSVIIAVGLAATAVVMAVTTAHSNSMASKLRHDGVPVQATVAKCVGVSSGIGMGVEYYQCEGHFTLNGKTYDEAIKGNRAKLAAGQTVDALVLPTQPSTLSVASAVRSSQSSAGDYAAPIVLGVLSVVLGAIVLSRRRRRATPPLP